MKTIRAIQVLSLVAVATTTCLQAQPDTLDLTFNPGAGANSEIIALSVETNGNVLVGGYFTLFNGDIRNRIARLLPNGGVDRNFEPGQGPDGGVWAVAPHAGGKVLIGGTFGFINGLRRQSLARLRPDGSLDLTFPNVEVNGLVTAIAVQPDGKILIAGNFNSVQQTNRNNIARLNENGILDATFSIGTGASSLVNCVCLAPDGKILIGGSFTVFNGAERQLVARLNTDGSLDDSFDAGFIGGSTVTKVYVQADGKILIGGDFDSINGYSRQHLARLEADGEVDTTFFVSQGLAGSPRAIAVTSDDGILVAGVFSAPSGLPQPHIARFRMDGTVDTNFRPSVNSYISALTLQHDDKIVITGAFNNVNGTNLNRIARLNGSPRLPPGITRLDAELYNRIAVEGTIGETQRIEYATNLNIPLMWMPLTNVVMRTNREFILEPIRPGQRHYRAVTLPPAN